MNGLAVAVTGGFGYTGREIATQLLTAEARVVTLTNRTPAPVDTLGSRLIREPLLVLFLVRELHELRLCRLCLTLLLRKIRAQILQKADVFGELILHAGEIVGVDEYVR